MNVKSRSAAATSRMAKPVYPVRFGIIGLGWIGSRYLAASGGLDEVVITAVADPVPGRLPADGSLEAYGSYQQLARGVDLDAVVICTPPVTHAEIAGYFLDRGVAVLCEKPFAISEADAEEMCRRARENSCPSSWPRSTAAWKRSGRLAHSFATAPWARSSRSRSRLQLSRHARQRHANRLSVVVASSSTPVPTPSISRRTCSGRSSKSRRAGQVSAGSAGRGQRASDCPSRGTDRFERSSPLGTGHGARSTTPSSKEPPAHFGLAGRPRSTCPWPRTAGRRSVNPTASNGPCAINYRVSRVPSAAMARTSPRRTTRCAMSARCPRHSSPSVPAAGRGSGTMHQPRTIASADRRALRRQPCRQGERRSDDSSYRYMGYLIVSLPWRQLTWRKTCSTNTGRHSDWPQSPSRSLSWRRDSVRSRTARPLKQRRVTPRSRSPLRLPAGCGRSHAARMWQRRGLEPFSKNIRTSASSWSRSRTPTTTTPSTRSLARTPLLTSSRCPMSGSPRLSPQIASPTSISSSTTPSTKRDCCLRTSSVCATERGTGTSTRSPCSGCSTTSNSWTGQASRSRPRSMSSSPQPRHSRTSLPGSTASPSGAPSPNRRAGGPCSPCGC